MPKNNEITLVRLPDKPDFTFSDIPDVNPNYSPGLGVIYTFSDHHRLEDTFVIAYQRPNTCAENAFRLCIAIGGKVDLNTPVVTKANRNTILKTQGETLLIDEAVLRGAQATVSNAQGEDWNMSYVYTHCPMNQTLSQVRDLVGKINQRIDQEVQENPSLKYGRFGIYRLADILWIIKENVEKKEQEKERIQIKNYATDTAEAIIVFDDDGTWPLLSTIEFCAATETKSFDLLQPEQEAIAPFDGAGVLYGVMYEGELHFIMRERVRGGKSQFQVGVGGKFSHVEDQYRFSRINEESKEEFFEKLPLHQGMLIRHVDGRGHLVHYTGKPGDYAYVAAVSVYSDCHDQDLVESLEQINDLNRLLWPFGNFFINNLEFNPQYTLEAAKEDAQSLLQTYDAYRAELTNFVPAEVIRLLEYISDSEIDDLNQLKSAVKEQFGLNDKRPFLGVIDKIYPETCHALGDYTEARSTGLIKAAGLLSLIKGEIPLAEITYFHTDQVETQRTIEAHEVFKSSAAKALLHNLLERPEYQQQLGLQKSTLTDGRSIWHSAEDPVKSSELPASDVRLGRIK